MINKNKCLVNFKFCICFTENLSVMIMPSKDFVLLHVTISLICFVMG